MSNVFRYTFSKKPVLPIQAFSASEENVSVGQEWQGDHHEGQLAVDVVETDKDIIVISTLAGADTNQIDVSVHNDLLTIRGIRVSPLREKKQYELIHSECFWGKFSRTIVLPVDVKGDLAKADYKNGVLTILIPKRKADAQVPIRIVED